MISPIIGSNSEWNTIPNGFWPSFEWKIIILIFLWKILVRNKNKIKSLELQVKNSLLGNSGASGLIGDNVSREPNDWRLIGRRFWAKIKFYFVCGKKIKILFVRIVYYRNANMKLIKNTFSFMFRYFWLNLFKWYKNICKLNSFNICFNLIRDLQSFAIIFCNNNIQHLNIPNDLALDLNQFIYLANDSTKIIIAFTNLAIFRITTYPMFQYEN